MILLDAASMCRAGGYWQARNSATLASAALAAGEAGTLLLSAGTECENDRDNRAGAGLTI